MGCAGGLAGGLFILDLRLGANLGGVDRLIGLRVGGGDVDRLDGEIGNLGVLDMNVPELAGVSLANHLVIGVQNLPVQELEGGIVGLGGGLCEGSGFVGVGVGILPLGVAVGELAGVALSVGGDIADVDAHDAVGVLTPAGIDDDLADHVVVFAVGVVIGLVVLPGVHAGPLGSGSVGIGHVGHAAVGGHGHTEVEGSIVDGIIGGIGVQIPAQEGVIRVGGHVKVGALDGLAVVDTEGSGLIVGDHDLRGLNACGVRAAGLKDHAETDLDPFGIDRNLMLGHRISGKHVFLGAARVGVPAVEVESVGSIIFRGLEASEAIQLRLIFDVGNRIDLFAVGHVNKVILSAGKVDITVVSGIIITHAGAFCIVNEAACGGIGRQIMTIGVEAQELVVVIILVRVISQTASGLFRKVAVINILDHPVNGLKAGGRISQRIDVPFRGMKVIRNIKAVTDGNAVGLTVLRVYVLPLLSGFGLGGPVIQGTLIEADHRILESIKVMRTNSCGIRSLTYMMVSSLVCIIVIKWAVVCRRVQIS